ncbi:MAG TPA: malto-oligosyltrehalose synthase [Solirubrobacteraceae bacterium]|nr:malto-oligosyltrehalose synthase [Solirubrobacteraceae bacterium]
MGFQQARALVPYVRDLGVSHLYLSPLLQARSGSTSGYDVVDPSRVSEELGGERGLRELAAAGLGLIVDIVPNHMSACEENRFWVDERLRGRFFDIDSVTGRHRRFFDIDGLASVRQEDDEVFRATHEKVLQLVREGLVDGLRIDHIDGLADPSGYLHRLRQEGVAQLWVEKILQTNEALRDWPVEGTVGYEFLNDVTALFVDQWEEERLTELYAEFTGDQRSFSDVALGAQLEQATTTFQPEVERLRRIANLPGIRESLARLPAYRTYVEPSAGAVSDADRVLIELAQMPGPLASALLLQTQQPPEFVVRFQQTSPAVKAKGVEDTAFYRYNRLLALNEVGGDPDRFGISVETFHARNFERARRFPRGMLATSTHDTKRSGDVRARIAVIAEMPREWRTRVLLWRELNASLREAGAPDASEEYLLYQTLIGTWPIGRRRLVAYMRKALREAKLNTNWLRPDSDWEARVERFCVSVLAHPPFLEDFEPFAAEVAARGRRAAVGQTLLKLTCPGVPDIYQGDELELLELVDPDNRGPVDWERRISALAAVRAGAPPTPETAKLHLIVAVMELRARRPDAFAGPYVSVAAGPTVCAFMRGQCDVLVVVRLRPGYDLGSLVLPDRAAGQWRDVLDDEVRELECVVQFEQVIGPFGVGLLERT